MAEKTREFKLAEEVLRIHVSVSPWDGEYMCHFCHGAAMSDTKEENAADEIDHFDGCIVFDARNVMKA